MGLAASQARMLLLTSRKSDVEAQMMSISNQKLSLSRQSAKLSEDYSNALNAQKLQWNVDDSSYDLSYGLMMQSNLFLLQSSDGAVIDEALRAKLGLAQEGSAGDLARAMTQDTFLQKMGITDASVRELAIAGAEEAPAGGPAPAVSGFNFVYSDFTVMNNAGYGYLLDSGKYIETISSGESGWRGPNMPGHAMGDARDDLASNVDIAAGVTTKINTIGSALGTELRKQASKDLPKSYLKNITAAINYALVATNNKFLYNMNDTDAKDGAPTISSHDYKFKEYEDDSSASSGKNRICVNRWVSEWDWAGINCKGKARAYVDSTAIANTFLSYFDQYLAQMCSPDTDGNGTHDGTASSKVGEDTTTRGATGGVGSATGTDTKPSTQDSNVDKGRASVSSAVPTMAVLAARLLNIYNAINSAGWKTDTNINNADYMKSQVMSGNMKIMQITQSGWSVLSPNDMISPMQMVSDEEAVTQAEADYEAGKDKLDYKESQLDVSMNNLDTERSAVETEVESVQKIIDKNIERSFKMFQA